MPVGGAITEPAGGAKPVVAALKPTPLESVVARRCCSRACHIFVCAALLFASVCIPVPPEAPPPIPPPGIGPLGFAVSRELSLRAKAASAVICNTTKVLLDKIAVRSGPLRVVWMDDREMLPQWTYLWCFGQ